MGSAATLHDGPAEAPGDAETGAAFDVCPHWRIEIGRPLLVVGGVSGVVRQTSAVLNAWRYQPLGGSNPTAVQPGRASMQVRMLGG